MEVGGVVGWTGCIWAVVGGTRLKWEESTLDTMELKGQTERLSNGRLVILFCHSITNTIHLIFL